MHHKDRISTQIKTIARQLGTTCSALCEWTARRDATICRLVSWKSAKHQQSVDPVRDVLIGSSFNGLTSFPLLVFGWTSEYDNKDRHWLMGLPFLRTVSAFSGSSQPISGPLTDEPKAR